MYALVKTGGKQYRVAKDDTILVERIAADEGTQVILSDVVMLGDGDKVKIGTPTVAGAAHHVGRGVHGGGWAGVWAFYPSHGAKRQATCRPRGRPLKKGRPLHDPKNEWVSAMFSSGIVKKSERPLGFTLFQKRRRR